MERILFARLEIWGVCLIALVAMAGGGFWAWRMLSHDAFPMPQIREVREAVRGIDGDDRALIDRLVETEGFDPLAFTATQEGTLVADEDLVPVTLADRFRGISPHIDSMRVLPAEGPRRFFVVYGSFVWSDQEANLGVALLDSAGELHRAWPIKVEGAEYEGPHIGLALTPDGGIVTNTHGIMTRQDWCGGEVWRALWEPTGETRARYAGGPGGYDWHHDILYRDGVLYSFRGPAVSWVDAESGALLGEISYVEMMQWSWANGTAFFDARHRPFPPEEFSPETERRLLHEDGFHHNKVDVLTAEMAADYPMFEAGDMLMSVRDLNLVAVLRPSEQRVVWWRYGLASRPHDATFIDGGIEVFNNAPYSLPGRPTIRRLDLETQSFEDIFALSDWNMRMRFRGNFERVGDRLLTSDTMKGRMIAGRTDGTLDMVFENGFRDRQLWVLNATEISGEQFAEFEGTCDG
ncbi:MAG: arylsulfotransferase family protein [Pseudomonadota bacterium]